MNNKIRMLNKCFEDERLTENQSGHFRMAQVDRLVDGSLDNELLIKEITGAQEPIAPLTDHPKYCRLSKQAGSLCARARDGSFCVNPCHEYNEKYFIYPDFTSCFIPEKQQPVELPKDPLSRTLTKP